MEKKTFNKIDYKGKHYVIQDKGLELNELFDVVIGEISKEEAMDKDFVLLHKDSCEHYGIPCYVGTDKDLIKIYD